MRECFVVGKSLPEAYHKALEQLYKYGDITECPDYDQKQKEVSMTMYVEEALSEPMISRLFIGGFRELQQYEMEILDGILNFRIGNGWDYTYNSRINEQLDFLHKELRRNPDSRRAVIDIRDWRKDTEEGNDAPACLQHMQFFIRNGKLHQKVLMRSNDAPEATFMNAFGFIKLQERIAKNLDVEVGSYTHRANSFHCYEKDFKLLEGYIARIEANDNLTYEYNGFFKDLMAESIPDILRQVDILKSEQNNK